MSPEKPTLDTLVREAKASPGREVDWSKVEEKLFPRIEREARAQAAHGAYGGRKSRGWVAAAVLVAAAAAVPLFLGQESQQPAKPLDAEVTPLRAPSAIRIPISPVRWETE